LNSNNTRDPDKSSGERAKLVVPGLYRNKKNGNIYKAYHFLTDCTKGRSGSIVIGYALKDSAHVTYVCELNEFLDKFERFVENPKSTDGSEPE